jgi:hypothetical protein
MQRHTHHLTSFFYDVHILHPHILPISHPRHPLLNAYIKLDVSGKPAFAMCSGGEGKEGKEGTGGAEGSDVWEVARRGVQTVQVQMADELRDTWQQLFGTAINAAQFDDNGPLWR